MPPVVLLSIPWARESNFEPQLVAKRQAIITEQLEEKAISLYGMGLSMRDMSAYIAEIYGFDISAQTLSNTTDRVIPLVKDWPSRPLELIYPFVWLDAMHHKVRQEGRVVARYLYNVLGVNTAGQKELIGCALPKAKGPASSSPCSMTSKIAAWRVRSLFASTSTT